MSNNKDDGLLNDLEKVKLPSKEKKLLVQGNRQNLFSVAWSKLAALITATPTSSKSEVMAQSEHYNDSIRSPYFHTRFSDRVDPSLYYTILFHHERF